MRHQWTIVGAGPAGILTIGKLLDNGVPPEAILWIDDEFYVGRIGKYYQNVPSNDYVRDWIEVFTYFPIFQKFGMSVLREYSPDSNQPLGVIFSILFEITEFLHKRVDYRKDHVKELKYQRNRWYIRLKKHKRIYNSKNVVLATGSHPLTLNYGSVIPEIPLDTAIDKNRLSDAIYSHETIAVIGSGQSAILLLKFLSELGVQRIINFHTININETITNLKAETLDWAQTNLTNRRRDGNEFNGLNTEIIRVYNDAVNRNHWLPQCSQVIYAVGYERNTLPRIRNTEVDLDNNEGILGPHLFGCGIAFPEKELHADGRVIRRVGIMSFTRFLNKNIPTWLESSGSINSKHNSH